jgi:hypothetical protein
MGMFKQKRMIFLNHVLLFSQNLRAMVVLVREFQRRHLKLGTPDRGLENFGVEDSWSFFPGVYSPNLVTC